jgi:hypothetical protein
MKAQILLLVKADINCSNIEGPTYVYVEAVNAILLELLSPKITIPK